MRSFGFSSMIAMVCFSSQSTTYAFVAYSPTVSATSHASLFAESSFGNTANESSASSVRRSVLLSGTILAGASLLANNLLAGVSENSQQMWIGSTRSGTESGASTLMERVESLDQAIQMIEGEGDKRFLHAVVASDYHFLYGPKPSSNSNSGKGPKELSDELLESLEVGLQDRPIRVKETQLALSSRSLAEETWKGQEIGSLWPLNGASTRSDIHYAWPSTSTNFASLLNMNEPATMNNIIVDGIDCGRMSLEDALEGDLQVLVQAERFLWVPERLEAKLLERLRGAFLI